MQRSPGDALIQPKVQLPVTPETNFRERISERAIRVIERPATTLQCAAPLRAQ
jgi:hypothetical protein